MYKITPFFLLSLLAISSCTTVSYKEAFSPDENQCLVYVFRDEFELLYSNYIKVDGVTYAQLLDKSYTTFNLKTGKKQLNIRWFPLSGGINLNLDFECLPNTTHYITTGGSYDYGFPVATRKIAARVITKEEAESRIENYKNKEKK